MLNLKQLYLIQAALSVWRSHEHNMGMAFDRMTWNKIKECSEVGRNNHQQEGKPAKCTFYTFAAIVSQEDQNSFP